MVAKLCIGGNSDALLHILWEGDIPSEQPGFSFAYSSWGDKGFVLPRSKVGKNSPDTSKYPLMQLLVKRRPFPLALKDS